MKQLRLFAGLLVLIIAAATAHSVALSSKRAKATKFKVRVENISDPAGQTAADGTRWPFAISPGMFILHRKENPLFTPGRKDRGFGLEAQAEDGNPAELLKSLQEEGQHLVRGGRFTTGLFNTPVGATSPGPILPGGAYEFTVTATPGTRLTVAVMFGQSNDLFYAPDYGIALFDARDEPVGGDVTSQFMLWDAGTEVNQEPGVGADQAPRQKAPNTGAAEGGVVRLVKDGYSYPETGKVMRVTITPEM
ncbi:MAG TPA: spondin domain-containing protein [Pyrinomonadaceae bacterium]|nr:spondin domain-containing protein [Pyrinomonadaceae bacterium]